MLNPLVEQALKNLLSKEKITQVGDRYFAGSGPAPICALCHGRIKKDEKILVDNEGAPPTFLVYQKRQMQNRLSPRCERRLNP